MLTPTHPSCAPAARVNQLLKEGILQPYLQESTKTALKSTCKAYNENVDNEGVGERIFRYADLLAKQIEPSVGNRKNVARRLWSGWRTAVDPRTTTMVLRDCRDMVWHADETCGHKAGHKPRGMTSSERRYCNALIWSAKHDKPLADGLIAADKMRGWNVDAMLGLLGKDTEALSKTLFALGTGAGSMQFGITTMAPAAAAHWKIGGTAGKLIGTAFGCGSLAFTGVGAIVLIEGINLARSHVADTAESRRYEYATQPTRDYFFCELITGRRTRPRLRVAF